MVCRLVIKKWSGGVSKRSSIRIYILIEIFRWFTYFSRLSDGRVRLMNDWRNMWWNDKRLWIRGRDRWWNRSRGWNRRRMCMRRRKRSIGSLNVRICFRMSRRSMSLNVRICIKVRRNRRRENVRDGIFERLKREYIFMKNNIFSDDDLSEFNVYNFVVFIIKGVINKDAGYGFWLYFIFIFFWGRYII